MSETDLFSQIMTFFPFLFSLLGHKSLQFNWGLWDSPDEKEIGGANPKGGDPNLVFQPFFLENEKKIIPRGAYLVSLNGSTTGPHRCTQPLRDINSVQKGYY